MNSLRQVACNTEGLMPAGWSAGGPAREEGLALVEGQQVGAEHSVPPVQPLWLVKEAHQGQQRVRVLRALEDMLHPVPGGPHGYCHQTHAGKCLHITSDQPSPFETVSQGSR